MSIPKHIKPKPDIFKVIPGLWGGAANTIYPFIFLPKQVYLALQKENPDIRHQALLVHEQFHLERQRQMGILVFGLKYFFSKSFRHNEEIQAVKAAMKFLKTKGFEPVFNQDPPQAPHNLFLYPVSKFLPRSQIEELWRDS